MAIVSATDWEVLLPVCDTEGFWSLGVLWRGFNGRVRVSLYFGEW